MPSVEHAVELIAPLLLMSQDLIISYGESPADKVFQMVVPILIRPPTTYIPAQLPPAEFEYVMFLILLPCTLLAGNPLAADIPNQALNHAATAVQAAAAIAVQSLAALPQLGFINEDSGQSFVLDIADLFREAVLLDRPLFLCGHHVVPLVPPRERG